MRYDRSWVDRFFDALDERGVRYVDNTQTLRTKTEEGEVVYNQKYDANHWNDLGAYYGTNAILEELQRDFPSVHVNGTADLNMDYELKTSLPVSEFPIHEMVPAFTLKSAVDPAAGELYKRIGDASVLSDVRLLCESGGGHGRRAPAAVISGQLYECFGP